MFNGEARAEQGIVRQKRQTSIPKQPYVEAGLEVNDRMRVRAEGPGRLVFERIEEPETTSPRSQPLTRPADESGQHHL